MRKRTKCQWIAFVSEFLDRRRNQRVHKNTNDKERAWLPIKLIGLKPRELYDPFLELFPRLAEWADEHGMSDEDLKLRFSNRSYQINSERNSDFTGVMSNLPKLRILVFTDTALFYDMSSVEVAMKLQVDY